MSHRFLPHRSLLWWHFLLTLGEAIQNACGFGLYFVNGEPRWDLTTNVHILQIDVRALCLSHEVLFLKTIHKHDKPHQIMKIINSLGYHLDECWLVALRLVAFCKIWELVVLQMSKHHLHKCQTSLGWVHKLVTHASNIPDWLKHICINKNSNRGGS